MTTPAAMSRLSRVFGRLTAALPFDVVLEVVVDPNQARRQFPNARDFAWCEASEPIKIVVSGRLAFEPGDVIEGVLRHELGHAIDFHVGARQSNAMVREAFLDYGALGPERRADALALLYWGDPIRYDSRNVQTIGPGVSPRPSHLGR